MKKIAFALAAVATAATTNFAALSPAMAQPPSVTIDTTGYDVGTQAGYDALAGQVGRASRQVCGNFDMRNLDIAPEVIACRSETHANAMAQLDQIAGEGRVTVVASR